MEDAASIAILVDRRTGEEYNICRYAISIGRELGNDVVLVSDKTISRQHAQIQYVDGMFHLQDLNSKNGSRLNGKRIDKLTPLNSGDELSFGLTQMVFLLVAPEFEADTFLAAANTETLTAPVAHQV